ncbi:MAG: protoheme IX farnesyltransferase, partial [Eudoraea sp.]
MKTVVGTANNTKSVLTFADFKEITKSRLALSVVFSSLAGYLLGAYEVN